MQLLRNEGKAFCMCSKSLCFYTELTQVDVSWTVVPDTIVPPWGILYIEWVFSSHTLHTSWSGIHICMHVQLFSGNLFTDRFQIKCYHFWLIHSHLLHVLVRHGLGHIASYLVQNSDGHWTSSSILTTVPWHTGVPQMFWKLDVGVLGTVTGSFVGGCGEDVSS